jgi:hypothetical protein
MGLAQARIRQQVQESSAATVLHPPRDSHDSRVARRTRRQPNRKGHQVHARPGLPESSTGQSSLSAAGRLRARHESGRVSAGDAFLVDWRLLDDRSGVAQCLCHRKCNDRVRTGRSGRHRTHVDQRALSRAVWQVLAEHCEFRWTPDQRQRAPPPKDFQRPSCCPRSALADAEVSA